MKWRFLLSTLVLTACASAPEKARLSDREKVRSELEGEMSLKADREEPAGLRKDIPPDKQKSNDELALFLSLTKQGSESPQVVREKLQALVYKRRSSFRAKVQNLRDTYRNDEAKRRDAFLAKQKTQRDDFKIKRRDAKETREFFSGQDKERLSFFADERSRRQSFESEMSAQSKDFDAYMREKQKEFDEQYRIYSKQFSEKRRPPNAVTGDEFRRLEEAPAEPLGVGP